jgi:hypothetical protein
MRMQEKKKMQTQKENQKEPSLLLSPSWLISKSSAAQKSNLRGHPQLGEHAPRKAPSEESGDHGSGAGRVVIGRVLFLCLIGFLEQSWLLLTIMERSQRLWTITNDHGGCRRDEFKPYFHRNENGMMRGGNPAA